MSKLEWMHIACVSVAQKYHHWRCRLHGENSCSKTEKRIWNWNYSDTFKQWWFHHHILTEETKEHTNSHIVTNHFFTIFKFFSHVPWFFWCFFSILLKKHTTPWWLQALPSTHRHLGRHLFGQVRPQESAANVHDILAALAVGRWGGGRFSATEWW